MTITEKIDGTNSAIHIEQVVFGPRAPGANYPEGTAFVRHGGSLWAVAAQDRNKFLSGNSDNHGFYEWVWDRAECLAIDLGPGVHFGEFWGRKINSGYNMTSKRLSLFNTRKWTDKQLTFITDGLGVVPVLYEGGFSTNQVLNVMESLSDSGSIASPGFMKPEGVCVYHHRSRQIFKYTFAEEASLSRLEEPGTERAYQGLRVAIQNEIEEKNVLY